MPEEREKTKLHEAVQQGDLERAKKYCLDQPELINKMDDEGNTALHLLLREGKKGHYMMASWLVTNKEKELILHKTNDKGELPGDIAMNKVHLQLNKEEGVNSIFQYAWSCVNSLLTSCKEYSKRELKQEESQLFEAIKNNDAKKVESLLKKVGNNVVNNKGETPLNAAIKPGFSKDIITLLDKAPWRPNIGGQNPLHIMAYAGDIEDFKLIFETFRERIDINSKDNFNHTPLMLASATGNFSIVRYLAEKGAELSHKDIYGADAIKLLEVGADRGDHEYTQKLCQTKLFLEQKMGLTNKESAYSKAPKKKTDAQNKSKLGPARNTLPFFRDNSHLSKNNMFSNNPFSGGVSPTSRSINKESNQSKKRKFSGGVSLTSQLINQEFNQSKRRKPDQPQHSRSQEGRKENSSENTYSP